MTINIRLAAKEIILSPVIVLVLVLASASNAAETLSQRELASIFAEVSKANPKLNDLQLTHINLFDDFDKAAIRRGECGFVVRFNIDEDPAEELFVSAYSKASKRTYLLAIKTANNKLRLWKFIEFHYPRLCIKQKDKDTLIAINELESDTNGDVVWNGSDLVYKEHPGPQIQEGR